MVFIILINIGISVPIYQESDRSCIYVLVVSIVSVFLRFCAVASCDITRVFENIDQYSTPIFNTCQFITRELKHTSYLHDISSQ